METKRLGAISQWHDQSGELEPEAQNIALKTTTPAMIIGMREGTYAQDTNNIVFKSKSNNYI